MKYRHIITILCLFIGFYSCNGTPEYFIGKWQILQVVEHTETIDLAENWMHLKSNGTFESYDGELKKTESGKWSYESDGNILFIDGEGENGDSEWMLSIRNDTLFFHSTSDKLYLIAKKMAP